MATELHDCIEIDAWRRRSERIVSVCHSLRYHPTYRRIKSLLDENAIGQIVSLDQLEGVDPIHQSHSFVRGNWGNEGRSAFMLLAKSCHDIDVIMHLIGRSCQRVSSFGSLSHFKATERPAGAPDRCSAGCPHEKDCPYSAFKVYGQGMSWGGYIGLNRLTQAERDEFVRSSPYGLCVYNTDNDVVDHQVVNFEFEGGATATFTMTAFAPGGRRVRIHGSHGYINADIEAHTIDLHRFWGSQTKPETIVVPREEGGHGGGDANILSTFFRAVRENDPSLVLSDTAESLRTHTVTFAAEASRRQQQVVEIDQFIEHAMGSFAAVCNQ
jgi:predicted dehydrogenase